MKLAGKKLEGPNVETIVFPRGGGDPIVLHAQAVLSYDEFNKLCTQPNPPTVIKRGGTKTVNLEDPSFKAASDLYGRRRFAWLVLKSLQLGTPELEWESVDFGNPDSWLGYEDELKAAGFSEIEIGRIHRGVMVANALDDDKLEEARNAFLASQQAPADL